MATISLADAKAHLSALVDQAEAGLSVDITRRGKAVARLSPVMAPRKRITVEALKALTASMPAETETAATLVRAMRDSDRY